jgi:hypothetical protein
MLTQPAFGPRTALMYVTGGALIDVWTLVWYFTRDHQLTNTQWFWVSGFFLTGLTLIILGLVLGPLGRAARRAELPPPEATGAEAGIQGTAAAHPPAVVAAPGVGGAAVPNPAMVNPAVTAQPAAVQPAAPAAPPGTVLGPGQPQYRMG